MADEEWRIVDCAPAYRVSSLGRLEGPKGKICALKPMKTGYIQWHLRHEGVRIVKQSHIIVATAFLPNPEELPIVNHINGRRDDNRVDNLEWTTVRENRNRRVFHKQGNYMRPVIQFTLAGTRLAVWASAVKASAATGVYRKGITRCCRGELDHSGGYRWAYDELEPDPGEEWRWARAKGRTIEVSSLGRFRTRGGGTAFGALVNGYRVASGGVSVHRLIAEAFCPKEEGKNVVNHKDGDSANNRSSNLEWVTQAENVQHAVDAGLRSKIPNIGRPVRRLLNGESIAEYPSIAAASRDTDIPLPNIVDVCKERRQTAGGTSWEYIDPAPLPPHATDLVEDSDPIWAELEALPLTALKIADDDPIWSELGI